MKLLISTYACAPDRGSEHAVGWNWTTEAHRLGHRVWALTSIAHSAAIEAACREDSDLAGINWIFPKVAGWPLREGVEPAWERTYNLLWQRAALRHARVLHHKVEFDAIHHLTWGGVRAPTFLGALGAPLIIGPVGGGETSPAALRDTFTLRSRIAERLRDLSNASITINPITRGGLAQAKVIFVRTPDTQRLLTSAMQRKSSIFADVTLQRSQVGAPRSRPPGPPRLLYAGRLLYWKGVHIAIRALAQLLPRMPEARLTIVGKGPEGERLKAEAANLGDRVEFIPWLPRQQFLESLRQPRAVCLSEPARQRWHRRPRGAGARSAGDLPGPWRPATNRDGPIRNCRRHGRAGHDAGRGGHGGGDAATLRRAGAPRRALGWGHRTSPRVYRV